jgi:hypothetical protein
MLSTEEFLSILFEGAPSEHFLELRAISNERIVRGQKWFSTTANGFKAASNQAASWDADQLHVYFGVQPRYRRGGTGEDVAAIRTLYADQDCGWQRSLPEKQNAEDRLFYLCKEQRIPDPTFVVDSGHGIHSYWILTSPIEPGDERFRQAMSGLTEELSGDSSVISLSQIMRLPGTTNWKDPDTPVPCLILDHNMDCRADIAMFPCRPGLLSATTDSPLPTDLSPVAKLLVSELKKHQVLYRVRRRRDGSIRAIVLRGHCPICGGISRKTGKPDTSNIGTAHITPLSLDLKCKRTCPAQEHSYQIEKWLPELFKPVPTALKKFIPVPLDAVPDLLAELWSEARSIAENGDVPIIAISPEGTGKTRFALQRLAEDAAKGQAGTLLVPTYKLAEEKAQELQVLAPGTKTLVYQSIRQSCMRIKEIEKWQKYLRHQRGTICRKCQLRSSCPAWTQFEIQDREHTVGIATHAYISELLGRNACGEYLVVDETFQAVERTYKWTLNDLGVFFLPHTVEHEWYKERTDAGKLLYYALLEAKKEWEDKKKRNELDDFPSLLGQQEISNLIKRIEDIDESASWGNFKCTTPPVPLIEEIEKGPPRRPLPPPDFDKLVDSFGSVAIELPGARSASNPKYRLFEVTVPEFRNKPVILLDATARHVEPILQKHFAGKELKLLEARVMPGAHEILAWYKTTSYMSVRLRDQQRLCSAIDRDLDWLLRQSSSLIRKTDPSFGFITLKKIRPFLEKAVEKRGLDAVYGHYGALRGTNDFEQVDILCLIGDPVPSISQARYEAEIMEVDTNVRIQGTRNAELSQAIGRARGIRRTAEQPVFIACMTSSKPPVCLHKVEECRGGRPVLSENKVLQAVIEKLYDYYGFWSTKILDPESPLHGLFRELAHNWLLKGESLIYQFWPNTNSLREKSWRDKVKRATRKLKETGGFFEISAKNPGGRKGQIKVQELIEGSWDRFISNEIPPENLVSFNDFDAPFTNADENSEKRVQVHYPDTDASLSVPEPIKVSMRKAREAFRSAGKWFRYDGTVFGKVDMSKFWKIFLDK